jgi:hypothetical protein
MNVSRNATFARAVVVDVAPPSRRSASWRPPTDQRVPLRVFDGLDRQVDIEVGPV